MDWISVRSQEQIVMTDGLHFWVEEHLGFPSVIILDHKDCIQLAQCTWIEWTPVKVWWHSQTPTQITQLGGINHSRKCPRFCKTYLIELPYSLLSPISDFYWRDVPFGISRQKGTFITSPYQSRRGDKSIFRPPQKDSLILPLIW